MQINENLKSFIILFVSLLIGITGCINDAERDNPLDPKSPNFRNQGDISGKVYTYYPPYHPIEGANIFVTPGNYWTVTDENGDFIFENLPENQYTVVAACSGYDTDSVQVDLKAAANKHIQFNLNGLPQILEYKIVSGHLSQWYPFADQYLIQTSIKITDLDGVADIKQVRLNLPDFNFIDTLGHTNDPEIFRKETSEDQLQLNLHQLLGHPFFLQIEDHPGSILDSSPIFIARIIKETPESVSPQGSSIVGPQPRLLWKKIKLPFPFTYKIEVNRVEQGGIIRTLAWSANGINPDSTTTQVSDSLSTGDYVWTISIEDEFGNWSRSRDAAFHVN